MSGTLGVDGKLRALGALLDAGFLERIGPLSYFDWFFPRGALSPSGFSCDEARFLGVGNSERGLTQARFLVRGFSTA